jgi:hypothetical protein
MVVSSQAVKELKRVNLNILPNSAFGCPTHDLHGFSHKLSHEQIAARMARGVDIVSPKQVEPYANA